MKSVQSIQREGARQVTVQYLLLDSLLSVTQTENKPSTIMSTMESISACSIEPLLMPKMKFYENETTTNI